MVDVHGPERTIKPILVSQFLPKAFSEERVHVEHSGVCIEFMGY